VYTVVVVVDDEVVVGTGSTAVVDGEVVELVDPAGPIPTCAAPEEPNTGCPTSPQATSSPASMRSDTVASTRKMAGGKSHPGVVGGGSREDPFKSLP
jgi:hypothetical protein